MESATRELDQLYRKWRRRDLWQVIKYTLLMIVGIIVMIYYATGGLSPIAILLGYGGHG